VYSCQCGAVCTINAERDVEGDPYVFEFLEEGCTRCSEIAGGAKPKRERVVQEAIEVAE
jgi:hypothetical protein